MWKAVLRKLSNDSRSTFKLSSEYVKSPLAQPRKKVLNFKEGFDSMKEKFGPDYQTPYDKYDLHVPKVEVQEDNRSNFRRYHERHDFYQSKTLMMLCFLGLFGAGLLIIRKRREDKIHEAETREALKAFLVEQDRVMGNFSSIMKHRREQIEELKNISR
mmetsp:Transcript_14700/g.27241  ORF Transcript_14700/g.27241 Transcript_14700/m.27241 type:complete len:159 (+) Transcript_14700:2335-2811(+)